MRYAAAFEVQLYIFVRAPAVAEAKESAGGAGGAAAADADVSGAADAADAADTAADVLAAADAAASWAATLSLLGRNIEGMVGCFAALALVAACAGSTTPRARSAESSGSLSKVMIPVSSAMCTALSTAGWLEDMVVGDLSTQASQLAGSKLPSSVATRPPSPSYMLATSTLLVSP